MNKLQSASRNQNLQILRFIAAFLVLITHLTFYISERLDSNFSIWNGGEAGVPIFFVISGYVMYLSGSKLERDAAGASYFLRRRIARVFPMYWLMTTLKILISIAVPATVLHNRPEIISSIASYLLFPMINGEGEVRPIHGVGWTLLHEMYFYYVFAIALWLRRSPFNFCLLIIGGFWLAGLVFSGESAVWRVCTSPLNLLFLSGMKLCELTERGTRLPNMSAIGLAGIAAVMLSSKEFLILQREWLAGFNMAAVLLVGSVLCMNISGIGKIKNYLASLGDSSYSLYMIHPILAPAFIMILKRLHLANSFVVLLIDALLCVVIAHVIYLLVEKRLNKKASQLLDKVRLNSLA